MPFIEKADLGKFSLEEAQLLSGKTDLHECCDFLHEVGTKVITITLGSDGTLVSTAKSKHTIPSISVKPIDTTGAGDAFIGCLLYQIASLKDPNTIIEDEKLLSKGRQRLWGVKINSRYHRYFLWIDVWYMKLKSDD